MAINRFHKPAIDFNRNYESSYVPLPIAEMKGASEKLDEVAQKNQDSISAQEGEFKKAVSRKVDETGKQAMITGFNTAIQDLNKKYNGNYANPNYTLEKNKIIAEWANRPEWEYMKKSYDMLESRIKTKAEIEKAGGQVLEFDYSAPNRSVFETDDEGNILKNIDGSFKTVGDFDEWSQGIEKQLDPKPEAEAYFNDFKNSSATVADTSYGTANGLDGWVQEWKRKAMVGGTSLNDEWFKAYIGKGHGESKNPYTALYNTAIQSYFKTSQSGKQQIRSSMYTALKEQPNVALALSRRGLDHQDLFRIATSGPEEQSKAALKQIGLSEPEINAVMAGAKDAVYKVNQLMLASAQERVNIVSDVSEDVQLKQAYPTKDGGSGSGGSDIKADPTRNVHISNSPNVYEGVSTAPKNTAEAATNRANLVTQWKKNSNAINQIDAFNTTSESYDQRMQNLANLTSMPNDKVVVEGPFGTKISKEYTVSQQFKKVGKDIYNQLKSMDIADFQGAEGYSKFHDKINELRAEYNLTHEDTVVLANSLGLPLKSRSTINGGQELDMYTPSEITAMVKEQGNLQQRLDLDKQRSEYVMDQALKGTGESFYEDTRVKTQNQMKAMGVLQGNSVLNAFGLFDVTSSVSFGQELEKAGVTNNDQLKKFLVKNKSTNSPNGEAFVERMIQDLTNNKSIVNPELYGEKVAKELGMDPKEAMNYFKQKLLATSIMAAMSLDKAYDEAYQQHVDKGVETIDVSFEDKSTIYKTLAPSFVARTAAGLNPGTTSYSSIQNMGSVISEDVYLRSAVSDLFPKGKSVTTEGVATGISKVKELLTGGEKDVKVDVISKLTVIDGQLYNVETMTAKGKSVTLVYQSGHQALKDNSEGTIKKIATENLMHEYPGLKWDDQKVAFQGSVDDVRGMLEAARTGDAGELKGSMQLIGTIYRPKLTQLDVTGATTNITVNNANTGKPETIQVKATFNTNGTRSYLITDNGRQVGSGPLNMNEAAWYLFLKEHWKQGQASNNTTTTQTEKK